VLARLRKRAPTCTHPTTILLSVHKGASSFLASEFAPAMVRVFPGLRHVIVGQEIVNGRTVADLPLPPAGVVASRVYPFLYDTIVEDPVPEAGRFAGKKLLMLRRDPRDVAVSFYYSIRYSHTARTRNPDGFRAKREALQRLAVTEGVARETARTAINQFRATAEFLQRHPGTCLTTYEQLVGDFAGWMETVRGYLGWTPEQAAAVGAGLEQTVRAPARPNPRKHKRRVTPGNWREVFDDRLRDMFESSIGPLMAEAGYAW